MTHTTIIQVKTIGDATTLPGGIALRRRFGDGSYMVQDFVNPERDPAHVSYMNGAYDLTLVEALEEFHRRCQRREIYGERGGGLVAGSATRAHTLRDEQDGEEAYFAEIVDDEGNRHWSDLIFEAPNADEALGLARDCADNTGELQPGLSLQVRGPFLIPAIPACGPVA